MAYFPPTREERLEAELFALQKDAAGREYSRALCIEHKLGDEDGPLSKQAGERHASFLSEDEKKKAFLDEKFAHDDEIFQRKLYEQREV